MNAHLFGKNGRNGTKTEAEEGEEAESTGAVALFPFRVQVSWKGTAEEGRGRIKQKMDGKRGDGGGEVDVRVVAGSGGKSTSEESGEGGENVRDPGREDSQTDGGRIGHGQRKTVREKRREKRLCWGHIGPRMRGERAPLGTQNETDGGGGEGRELSGKRRC